MISRLPTSEDGHGLLYKGKKDTYCITFDTSKQRFTLWRVIIDETREYYEKISMALHSPLKLYDKIEALEK